jgi:hypothetical protein
MFNENRYVTVMTKALIFVKKSGLPCIINSVRPSKGRRNVFDLVLITKPLDRQAWESFIESQGIKEYSFPVQGYSFPCIQFLHLNKVKIK